MPTCLTAIPRTHRSSQSVSTSRHRSARDLYDAELQRAIQLSLEEVGSAGAHRPGYVPSPSPWQSSEPPLVDRGTRPSAASSYSREEEDDPDLKAAIEASLREANAPKPSAPIVIDVSDRSPYISSPGPGYAQSYPPSSATPKPRAPQIPSYDLEPLEEDAILTFNQTVEQVQAQGGRDLSRYPAVTELFDKANALRPKLAMSLNDTSRKERAYVGVYTRVLCSLVHLAEMLVEMHEKLSQAVKLYDKLLTEQLSRPSWRTAPSAAPRHDTGAYASQYQSVNGTYSQWQSQPTSQQVPATPVQPTSYFSPSAAPQSNGAYVASSPAEPSQHQMYQPQTAPILSPTSPSIQPRYGQESLPYAAMSPPPVSVPQYGAAPTPTPASLPVSFQPPAAASAPPPPPIQSQPQPQPQQAPSAPPLSRQNTFSGYPQQQQQPVANGYLARSNTVAASSHAPSQLQHLQQMSVPLPNFPQVPNTIPQYAPPEPERKEALLIDL